MNTNRTAKLLTKCLPHLLRAGDRLHVREDGVLSTVTSTRKGPAGTEYIAFSDHAEILVCGGTEVHVFA